MKLYELTGVKSKKNLSPSQLLKQLTQSGIKIAAGAFGVVLMDPKWNYVVKIFKKDVCYLEFIDYCMSHSSPHLPKFIRKPVKMSTFFRTTSGTQKGDKFYAVKIEKLKPISRSHYVEVFFPIMESAMWFTGRQQRDFDKLDWSNAPSNYEDQYQPVWDSHLELARTVFDLFNTKSERCFPDMHQGNVMVRDDGTIVITDPFGSFDDDMSKTLSDAFDLYYSDIEDLQQTIAGFNAWTQK